MNPYRENATMRRRPHKPIATYLMSIVLVGMLVGIVLLADAGCSFFQSPQGVATVTAGIDLAVCVLNHSQEPIQQIVTDCGAATAQDVIRILDAHAAAKNRESAK